MPQHSDATVNVVMVDKAVLALLGLMVIGGIFSGIFAYFAHYHGECTVNEYSFGNKEWRQKNKFDDVYLTEVTAYCKTLNEAAAETCYARYTKIANVSRFTKDDFAWTEHRDLNHGFDDADEALKNGFNADGLVESPARYSDTKYQNKYEPACDWYSHDDWKIGVVCFTVCTMALFVLLVARSMRNYVQRLK